MRIVLDGMGGDHAPAEIVKGAVSAAPVLLSCVFMSASGRKRILQRFGSGFIS